MEKRFTEEQIISILKEQEGDSRLRRSSAATAFRSKRFTAAGVYIFHRETVVQRL